MSADGSKQHGNWLGSPAYNPPQYTYKQRYYTYDEYFKPGGPIFFYFGNEDDVGLYVNHTGLMCGTALCLVSPLLSHCLSLTFHCLATAFQKVGEREGVRGQAGLRRAPILRRLEAVPGGHRQVSELSDHRAGHGRLCRAHRLRPPPSAHQTHTHTHHNTTTNTNTNITPPPTHCNGPPRR